MEKEKNNSGLIALVIVLFLLVLGLGGYIVYDKVLSNKETPVIDTTNDNVGDIDNNYAIYGEKISSLEEINLTTTNQEIKIGEKTFNIRTDDNSRGFYINDVEINDVHLISNVYLTDKYLFVVSPGRDERGISYAISEQGKVAINVNNYYTHDFKLVDGHLHAKGATGSDNYDYSNEKDLIIKYIDNTLIVTPTE